MLKNILNEMNEEQRKEEIAARIAARKREKPPYINNTELVERFRAIGGQIYHARPTRFNRGVTFAFVGKGRRMEVATAVQHIHDDFTKKMGTKTAIEHFFSGKTVILPLSKTPLYALRDISLFL